MPLIQYQYPLYVQDLVAQASQRSFSQNVLSQWKEVLTTLTPEQLADVHDEVQKDPTLLDYLVQNVTQKISLAQNPDAEKIQKLLDEEQQWSA